MVFSNLNDHEKNSFFSLLDEYFQSRPELIAKLQGAGEDVDVGQVAGRVAAAASAFSNNNTPPPARRGLSKNIDPPVGLQSLKRFGDVDTSTKKSMLVSGLSRKQPSTQSPLVIPSAFAAKKSGFVSRINSEPEPEPEPEPEDEEGEWAEALYDYDSTDPADLHIRANQRVLVIERTSDDWWKGEVDGQSGLFPAAYVKLL